MYSPRYQGCGLKQETETTVLKGSTIASKHNGRTNGPHIEYQVHQPSVEVESETWANPQLLQGEEFLMQWLASWDTIRSFNNVWKKTTQKKTSLYRKQAASP